MNAPADAGRPRIIRDFHRRRHVPETEDQRMSNSSDSSAGYMSGFGDEFATAALAGALPGGRDSSQQGAYRLYAERLTGTAFTAPPHANRRSWLYRIRPAAMHGPFEPFHQARLHEDFGSGPVTPDQLRWDPLPMPADSQSVDFVGGLVTMAGNGGSRVGTG